MSFVVYKKIIFGIVLIPMISALIITLNFVLQPREKFTSEISELTWPDGPVLIAMTTIGNPAIEGAEPLLHIYSSDGKLQLHLDGTFQLNAEFLTPKSMLVTGTLRRSQPTINPDAKMFYVTPKEIIPIFLSIQNQITKPSLSPTKQFIAYDYDAQHCISTFTLQAVGSCHDITAELPDEWKNINAYSTESEWMKKDDTYVVRVRSTTAHHEEPAVGPNMPPKRIQNEVARFFYNAHTKTMQKVDLDNTLVLKTPDIFLTDADRPLTELFTKNSDYKIISYFTQEAVGILQKSNKKIAKLADAPFYGKISTFDIYTFDSIIKR